MCFIITKIILHRRYDSYLILFIVILIVILLVSSSKLFAQFQYEITASSPLLPVGSGARAMGMAGAFIAVADDATAASWNPAGLTQLIRPEVSIVGNRFIRHDNSVFEHHPEATLSKTIDETNLNFLSIVFPRSILYKNIIFSLDYQHLYDINLHFKRRIHHEEVHDYGTLDLDILWDFNKSGRLAAISPALAVQVTEGLSLGCAVNIWPESIGTRENGWDKNFYVSHDGLIDKIVPYNSIRQHIHHYQFSGLNFNIGIRYEITPVIALGGVVKTEFAAHLDHRFRFIAINDGVKELDEVVINKERLIMPPSYGLGLALRLSDNLTIDLDLYRTEWDRHIIETEEGSFSAVTDERVGASSVKPTHHVRLGLEYLFIKPKTIIPFRTGLFYDPEPAKGNPNDFYGFSLGSGLSFQKISFDAAYQYRFARDVKTIEFLGQSDKDRITQHFIYLSLIYYL